MKLTSFDFKDNQNIPSEFTCDGYNVSPGLNVSDLPQNAKSLVLIMDDPDAPNGTWDHWILFNIPPDLKEIKKGSEPKSNRGTNSWGRTGYGGPCPPFGTHRYYFKLYALDTILDLPDGATKREIEIAMRGHIVAQAQLIGTYRRISQ